MSLAISRDINSWNIYLRPPNCALEPILGVVALEVGLCGLTTYNNNLECQLIYLMLILSYLSIFIYQGSGCGRKTFKFIILMTDIDEESPSCHVHGAILMCEDGP